MIRKDIVVIGASAGGIEALKILIPDLPEDLNAAVFITVHVSPFGDGILPQIFERAGSLPASNAKDWEPIQKGRIYVAPPDHHLLLDKGYVRVTRGPRENRFRPAIDPLFRSAALSFGARVVGVVLTGWLDDGTAGLHAIRERGGYVVVQHPDDAFAPSMPLNAIKHVEVDQILPLTDIGSRIAALVSTPAGEEVKVPVSEEMELEVKIAKDEQHLESGMLKWGTPSLYSCPECHGVLLQLNEKNIKRFRCHTGHAYSMESLLAEFATQNEESLWSAIRALEENVILVKGLARHAAEHNDMNRSEFFLKKAEEIQGRANLVRQALAPREPKLEGKEGQAAQDPTLMQSK